MTVFTAPIPEPSYDFETGLDWIIQLADEFLKMLDFNQHNHVFLKDLWEGGLVYSGRLLLSCSCWIRSPIYCLYDYNGINNNTA